MNAETHTGQLLVAAPSMQEPTFARTVLLMIAHGRDGALGVVLNRPSELRVADALPRFEPVAEPDVIFVGGPVGDGALLALGCPSRGPDRVANGAPSEGVSSGPEGDEATEVVEVVPGVGLVPLGAEGRPGAALERARLFVDYAGWGPGQLEGEIARGDWVVLDALPGDPFTTAPEDLWTQVLRRQGGPIAWLAHAPGDPNWN